MGNNAARLTNGEGIVVCLSPCVCNTPIGATLAPIPYMIVSNLGLSRETSENVLFQGAEAFTMRSRLSSVTGNEPGARGDIRRQFGMVSPSVEQG